MNPFDRQRVVCFLVSLTLVLFLAVPARAQVCNIKVVTDASPDYSDMDSMIHSITSNRSSPAEKCWAMGMGSTLGDGVNS